MKHFVTYCLALLFLPLLTVAQKVIVIKIDGTINPASAEFISSGIEKGVKDKAECLLLHLNTPGGLLKSTRLIVGNILQSPVPVIVYVSPGGAQAGSAGVFITMSAHIAAMATGTNIGAAHPVGMQGQSDPVMNGKVTNDAAAFIRTIAQKRKRNIEWAEEAVRNSVSLTEVEALEKNVINVIADSEQELLQKVNGWQVEVASGTKTLNTKNATIEVFEMSWVSKLLSIISDPNVAYILLMLGFYGILFELYSPGTILPGIIGVISLVLAFYSLQTLPVNYAGLALIVFAIVLFLLEIKIISHGILAIGGVLSLLIGSLILIRRSPTFEFVSISTSLIVATTLVTALFFTVIIGAGIKALRAKPVTGVEGMIGETGEVISQLNPVGRVKVRGEEWNAESAAGVTIALAEKIKIVRIENLKLFVEALN